MVLMKLQAKGDWSNKEEEAMTKKLNSRASMELDLDSILDLESSSDDDDHNNIPHRTVDEILNDSDSSSSSSASSSSALPSFNRTFIRRKQPLSNPPSVNSSFLQKEESPSQDEEESEATVVSSPKASSVSRMSKPNSPETLKSSKLEDLKVSLFSRRKPSGEFSGNSFALGRNLFGGVKPNPKPGAALAAAAAASRSVPTPHAAAIKLRRETSSTLLEKAQLSEDLQTNSVVVDSEMGVDENEVLGLENVQLDRRNVEGEEKGTSFSSSGEESVVSSHSNGEVSGGDEPVKLSKDEDLDVIGSGGDAVELFAEEDLKASYSLISTLSVESHMSDLNVDDESKILNSSNVVDESIQHNDAIENGHDMSANPELSNFASASEEWISYPSSANVEVNKVENDSILLGSETSDFEKRMETTAKYGDASLLVEETSSKSDKTDIVEDLDRKGSKKSGKKLRSSLKPLEFAEELEKKHASFGLHWEEGAAAQPMRLEGIRRGPPAVGYLHIDPDNTISRTISSQAFRREHGSPQVLAVHVNFIAVGMSKGLVLVVPSKYSAHTADNMDSKMLLLTSQGDKSQSPVTSMCFNQQGDLLLAGYGNGHLIVWDVHRATTSKVITGEHTAPVVHAMFLGQDSQATRQFKAVTGDCKGLVLLHTSTVVPLLNRYTVKTQCLLDGQRNGTVLCASPLLVDESGSTLTSSQGNTTTTSGGIGSMMGSVVGGVLFNEGSSLVEEGVVIFVTHQIALVIRLSPSLEVYAQLSKPDGVREGSMPYTAWKYMTQWSLSTESMTGETPARAALLAIVWDRKVQVAKLVKSELKIYKEWTIDSAAIGVEWLDDQMMVILTLRGQLCLFSKEGNELHRTSFAVDGSGADDLISYHTYFINLFGNPEKAYHNCIAVRGATIYVLGPMNLVVSRLLPWKERIQVLRKAGDWMGALDMAMRLYDGHAHGVIDLPRTLNGIREMIMPYLVELILSYVDEVFSYISVAFCNQIERDEQVHELKSKGNSVHSEMEDQFARVGGVAVEFCVHITRIDILFDEIFSKFVAVQHGGTFLELLEPYILKDMLGCLPPEIMQALVEHYSSKGWLQRVEQCVLHMDISSLDFNQVVRLCREHGLYGALIYLFNRGLDDFKAPLEELLLVVRSSQREDAAVIGYRMLVYLKYCFSGLAFPPGHGTLPPTRLPSLRTELLQFLLENSNAIDSQVATSFKTPTEACPNLYVLLWLDTEATLDVLRYAFIKEESSNSEVDANTEDSKESSENTEHQNLMAQKTVDTLIHVVDMGMSEEDGQTGINEVDFKEAWPSKKDIGHLLEFIAYFVTCKRATIPKTVLKHILEFLTSEIDVSLPSQNIEVSKRREKQVLTLLKNVPESDWDSSYVLHLCEKAQFHKVCGLIHTIRHQYVATLNDYMKDLDEPIHAFSFVNDMLLHLSEDENAPFRSAVISRIPELVTLSREGTLFLILDHFNKESDHILSELRSHPKSLFLYLKTTIEVHLSGKLDFSSLRNDNVLEVQHKSTLEDHTSALEAYCKRISDFTKLLRHTPVNVTDEMIELYLELLCQYERNSVLKFLETFENYRVEHCLRLCQEYGVIDAAAFLLERVGDVGSALLLTISGLNEKLSMLGTAVDNMVSDISSSSFSEIHLFNTIFGISEVNAVRDILSASIGLCQRNTQRLDPEESEFLWFKLLDSFCEPLKETSDDRTTSKGNHVGIPTTTFHIEDNEALITWRITKFNQGAHILHKLFAQFIKEIVEGMIGYVHLPTIMAKLLSDNGSQEFGDFKLTIMGMLGTYGFERRILDTAKSLIEDDTFYTMSLLRKGASHGYAPQNLICCICSCPITNDSSTSGIRVFNCGHTTHIQCEFQENETLNRHASGCPVCMPKKRTRGSRDKPAFTESGLVRSYVPRQQQTQGAITVQHPNESDLVEKPYGIHQISRFEILSNLQKSQRSFQIENLPQLRLAPPAVYHEKVQKGTDVLASSSTSVKNEKASKGKQLKELKAKGSSIRFPLRSSIFGNEKTRKR